MIDAQLMTTFENEQLLGGHSKISVLKMHRGIHGEYVHNQELDKLFLLNKLASSSSLESGLRSDQATLSNQHSQYSANDHSLDRTRRFQTSEIFLVETPPTTKAHSFTISTCYGLTPKTPCDGIDYICDTEDDTCESEIEMMEEIFDDDDDDDDDEEEEDEEEEEEYVKYTLGSSHIKPDDPSGLLNFVQNVTRDIHNLLARNKGMEDYCDIYEERFKTTLSGRELYYAELLALASNEDTTTTGRGNKRNRSSTTNSSKAQIRNPLQSPVSNESNSPLQMWNSTEHTVIYGVDDLPRLCNLPHEGKRIPSYGLGPLENLFRTYDDPWKNHHSAMISEPYSSSNLLSSYSAGTYPPSQEIGMNYGLNKTNSNSYSSLTLPMNMRKLPSSFWEEPSPESKSGLLTIAQTPDFNDLFYQWTSEKC